MNEIWHSECEPNFGTLVVVINSERKIIFFGYYNFMDIKPSDKWAYMEDLINNTIEENKYMNNKYVVARYWKGCYVQTMCNPMSEKNATIAADRLNKDAGMFDEYKVKQVTDSITMNKKNEYIMIDEDVYSVSVEMAKFVEAAYNLAKETDEDMESIINTVKKYGEFIGSVSLTIRK